MENDKTQQLYDVRGMVPYGIKEQIELDALKMVTSQKTIVGMAISQYYADLSTKTSTNIRQNYDILCKKTRILQENIDFLQKNNVFEVKITQILATFKHNLSSSSYDTLRELFFKEVIDLIMEYKLIYPDRSKNIDQIVKRSINKQLYSFYLDEFPTVKKLGPLNTLALKSINNTVGSIDYRNVESGKYENVDYENLPLSIVKTEVGNFKTVPVKFWAEKIQKVEEYFKVKFTDTMDYDIALEIFHGDLERLKDELKEDRTK